MEEFKGTKGEWIVVRGTDSVWIESPLWTVADIAKKDTEQEQLANAKLIAAAPDLLEALQGLMTAVNKTGLRLDHEMTLPQKSIDKALK